MCVGVLAPSLEDESADLFVAGDFEIVADGVAVGVEGPEEEGLGGLVQEVRNCILMIIHVKIIANFIILLLPLHYCQLDLI